MSSGHFLARGRIPVPLTASRRDVGKGAEQSIPGHPSGVLFIYGDNGIRKAVKKTCRWHVFRPWENPCAFDGIP